MERSSKIMEASAILKMVKYAYHNHFFIIDVIVRNNESTMRALLNYPFKGARGQVMKSYKVKLDEEIPYPSFLVNPYHHIKFVAKHIFYIVNESNAR